MVGQSIRMLVIIAYAHDIDFPRALWYGKGPRSFLEYHLSQTLLLLMLEYWLLEIGFGEISVIRYQINFTNMPILVSTTYTYI